jgi:hypothetical protein
MDVSKVIVPWTRKHPECMKSLAPFGPVYVNVDYEFAYWSLTKWLWEDSEPFVLVEHDVLVRPDTIPELEACPERWCAFSIWMGEGTVATFGCVRFRPHGRWPVPGPVEWQGLDMATEYALTGLGWTKHVHGPVLGHLNPNVVELDRRVAR